MSAARTEIENRLREAMVLGQKVLLEPEFTKDLLLYLRAMENVVSSMSTKAAPQVLEDLKEVQNRLDEF